MATEVVRAPVHRLGRKPIPKDEKPNEKFVRLAVPRMTAFKARARMLKNLASYDFSDAQFKRMIEECEQAVLDIRSAFMRAQSRGKNVDQFRFD